MSRALKIGAQLIRQQLLLAADALPTEQGDRWVTIRGRHVLLGSGGEVKTGWAKGQTLKPSQSSYDREQIRKRAISSADELQYINQRFDYSLARQGNFYAKDMLKQGISTEPISNLMRAVCDQGAKELLTARNTKELDTLTADVETAAQEGMYEALRLNNQIARARSTFNSVFFDNADIRTFNANGGDFETLQATINDAIETAAARVNEASADIQEGAGVKSTIDNLNSSLQETRDGLNELIQIANNVRTGITSADELNKQITKLLN